MITIHSTARAWLAAILVGATALTLSTATGSASAPNDTGSVADLLVWNHLGSLDQIQTGETASTLQQKGDIAHPLAVRGRGAASLGAGSHLSMSQEDFFGADPRQGTVEVFLQKRMPVATPFETPLPAVFGVRPYVGQWGPIDAYWSDGYSGYGGLQFEIVDGENVIHAANDLGWDQVKVGEWVHVMFVWDLDGIMGSADRLRIYRDGRLVATNTDEIASIAEATEPVKILATHAYARLGKPALFGDELVVWAVPRLP